jgi:membrane protease YdiL (CAAX protease family)
VALAGVTIPVLRDLIVGTSRVNRELLTAGSYLLLLLVAIIFARSAGFTAAQVGIRRPRAPAVAIGLLAGVMLVFPVWHWPAATPVTTGWLVMAVGVEEIVFRGVLFVALQRAGGLGLAIVGSTLAFALAHAGAYGWPGLALVILAGLYLGVVRALSRDCWAPGIAHLLMDLTSQA